jgi:threonine dehydrogenase-like Zn-dependent dehydrogenase
VTFEAAVAMIGTGRTTLAVLEVAAIGPADTVLITSAAGGMGALAVQAAKRAGATVIGAAGGPDKVATVRNLGADLGVDYLRPGWKDEIEAALGDRPVTVTLDGVGGDIGRAALELLGVMLLVNAYRHKEMERIISPNRCLALTSADGKSRRLWEICRTEKTLGDALTSTLHGTQSILVLASETVEIASFLVQAAHIFKNQKIPLPPHLSHIGKIADQPVYLGFLPAAETDQQADSKIDVSQLIRSQFYRPVKQALSEKNIKIPLLLRAMQQLKNHGDAEPAIVDTLSALFIGE